MRLLANTEPVYLCECCGQFRDRVVALPCVGIPDEVGERWACADCLRAALAVLEGEET